MLLKISKFLEKLSFKLRQKALYFELKHFILKGKSHIKPVYNYTRGIGKTYTLIQLAHKYDCPILVSNDRSSRYLQDMNRKMFKSPIKTYVCNEWSRGIRFNLVLVEEGIDFRTLRNIIIPSCKQVIGFDKQY
jgi:hypothetical protein